MAFIGSGAWQTGQSLTFGSASSITWTGIPTNSKKVRLVFQNVTTTTTNVPHISMRIGNGVVDSGNNYDWRLKEFDSQSSEGGDSNSEIRVTSNGHGSTAHRWYGVIDFEFLAGEHTNISLLCWSRYGLGSNNHTELAGARWTGGSAIDRIQLYHYTGNNYSGGRGTVFYA